MKRNHFKLARGYCRDDVSRDKTCLLITHVIPRPCTAGNEIRIAKLITWLKSSGIKVILLLNTRTLSESQEKLSMNVDDYYFIGKDRPE